MRWRISAVTARTAATTRTLPRRRPGPWPRGPVSGGIVICTTGIGVSMAANKVHGVRCALCGDPWSAEMTRRHNDANVLALGAGVVGPLLARQIVTAFLTHDFEGGRHQRRVDKVMAIEGQVTPGKWPCR